MKYILSQIKKDAYNQPFTFDEEVDVSEIASMDNDIIKIKPVRVSGNCVIDGEQVIFSLKISGEMILPCARTLVDVSHFFEIEEVEVFSESLYFGKEEEVNEVYPIDGEVINLMPCIEENILLAIPFRVFSDDANVLDNALFKGDGWAYSLEADEEVKKEKTIDPRLKKLQSFLDNNWDKE